MNKYSTILITLILISISPASYFQDENSPKSNKIMLGGGIRSDLGAGILYQRKIMNNAFMQAGIGFSPVDGFNATFGSQMSWRNNKRLRPIALLALSYASGIELKNSSNTTVTLNGEKSDYKTDSGIYGIIHGGFQFRIWKGLGLQYSIGWRQTFSGGDYELIQSTNESKARDALDAMTGSGLSFIGKGFWEF